MTPPHPLPPWCEFKRLPTGGVLVRQMGYGNTTGIGWTGPDPSAEEWGELLRRIAPRDGEPVITQHGET